MRATLPPAADTQVGAQAGQPADPDDPPDARWADALAAAALLAIDPLGLGGALLRARHGPQRDHWLAQLRQALPSATPWRRLPLHISDERLLGGLDLAATLQAGRPVAQRGVLAEADGGFVLVAMAERLASATAARLVAALDWREVRIERDGLALRQSARFAVVALDEGLDEGPQTPSHTPPQTLPHTPPHPGLHDGEQAPAALADRLAFHLMLDELPAQAPPAAVFSAAELADARARLPQVATGANSIAALCEAAQALGVASLRAPWLALRAACAAAALQGHNEVSADDLALAARLVLAPRAERWPETEPASDATAETGPAQGPDTPDGPNSAAPSQPAPAVETDRPPSPPSPPPRSDASAAPPDAPDPAQPEPPPGTALQDIVLAAALSALPSGLLERLKAGLAPRSATASTGRSGALQAGTLRGRPLHPKRGELRGGARLDLIATLRAAAPWQRLRRAEAAPANPPGTRHQRALVRVLVRPEDFHTTRRAQRRETITLFVVDASGSAALHRLAEAKGAVELLLADCYVRRDKVALLAFRGQTADLVLPPTRSLVRAKRALAGLAGGGGTPLAQALDAAAALAASLLRRGGTPLLVLMTDARANIARNGQPGREQATADALASARQLAALGLGTLMVDTAPGSGRAGAAGIGLAAAPAAGPGALPHVGKSAGRQLADALGALYLPLPQVQAAKVLQAVRGLAAPGAARAAHWLN